MFEKEYNTYTLECQPYKLIWQSSVVMLSQHFSPSADDGYASPPYSLVPIGQHMYCAAEKVRIHLIM